MARATVSVEIVGLERLLEKVASERLARPALRRALRDAAKAVKAEAVRRARPISRRLARRFAVRTHRAPVPQWIKVVNRYPGAWAIEKGRRAGAKMPPPQALRGGLPAARVVARRGLGPRPFMAPAAAASRAVVSRELAAAAREIERQWRI